MSDTVKLIIEIPKEAKQAFDNAESNDLKGGYYDHGGIIGKAIQNGIPLDDVLFALKKEIKEKCDRIDDIARANMYQYAPHREIQDLLCEILTSIDNAESEGV